MLPARTRMRHSNEFATTVRRGRRGSSRAVMVHVVPAAAGQSDGAAVRVGFIVSRAVGPAVVRNRVRRRLRHLITARLGALPAGVAVVVRAHPASAALTSAELAADVDGAFAQALGTRVSA
jgi:ribonuclease P protein component